MKILLVEDDIQLAKLVRHQLEQYNYAVDIAEDGRYAIDLVDANPYSLIILDVVLPGLNGIEVCQKLRNQGNHTPILMLTGQDDLNDKVLGLDAGADDYLVKPFELDELGARIRALLRRGSDVPVPLLQYGELTFKPASQELAYKGEPLSLRPKEIAILELMLRYPTQVFAADILLERLWNLADCPSTATIKTHIRSLRKSLDTVGAYGVIETLYGQGYRLNPEFLEPADSAEQDCPENQEKSGCRAEQHDVNPLSLVERSPSTCDEQLTSQQVVAQAWEKMQAISWQRLVRLKAILRSLQSLQPKPLTEPQWDSLCQEARALSHQLKGSLGTFGFKAASLAAKQVEKCFSQFLSNPGDKHSKLQYARSLVQSLDELVRQQITQKRLLAAVPPEPLSPSQDVETQVLLVSRDLSWQERLQETYLEHPFTLRYCSPPGLEHSLNQSLSAIAVELSSTPDDVDLELLQSLVMNYGNSLPILAIVEHQETETVRIALQKGATVCVPKSWSVQTLYSIIAEYVGPKVSLMRLTETRVCNLAST